MLAKLTWTLVASKFEHGLNYVYINVTGRFESYWTNDC